MYWWRYWAAVGSQRQAIFALNRSVLICNMGTIIVTYLTGLLWRWQQDNVWETLWSLRTGIDSLNIISNNACPLISYVEMDGVPFWKRAEFVLLFVLIIYIVFCPILPPKNSTLYPFRATICWGQLDWEMATGLSEDLNYTLPLPCPICRLAWLPDPAYGREAAHMESRKGLSRHGLSITPSHASGLTCGFREQISTVFQTSQVSDSSYKVQGMLLVHA